MTTLLLHVPSAVCNMFPISIKLLRITPRLQKWKNILLILKLNEKLIFVDLKQIRRKKLKLERQVFQLIEGLVARRLLAPFRLLILKTWIRKFIIGPMKSRRFERKVNSSIILKQQKILIGSSKMNFRKTIKHTMPAKEIYSSFEQIFYEKVRLSFVINNTKMTPISLSHIGTNLKDSDTWSRCAAMTELRQVTLRGESSQWHW